MSDKNKNREKYDPEVATVTREAFDGLCDLNWIEIPDYPFVMKYKFDEEGYTLMVSNLTAVYGEKLDEKAIQERFQNLNPYAEMLPKIILKHVKQSVKNILACQQAREASNIKITLNSNHCVTNPNHCVTIHHQFLSGMRFIFNFELEMLPDNQFKLHILRPTLLRALVLDEERTALQRKVEELEGKYSSPSSSGCSERRNIKAIYKALQEISPGSEVIDAFLYLQKGKIILPGSLDTTPNVSPTKGVPTKRVHSSSTSSSVRNRISDSKIATGSIPYKEDDSDVKLESQNTIQQSKEPEISLKIERAEEDNADMAGFNNSVNNLLTKTLNGKESNKRASLKMETAEEDSKEESASKPAPNLKPSPAKKKKLLKF